MSNWREALSSMARGTYTPLFFQIVTYNEFRWTLVANIVGSRSADRKLRSSDCHGRSNKVSECAKRWQQSLDPDLDRSEWKDTDVSIQETNQRQPFANIYTQDQILIDAVHRYGRHWKDIQRQHFQGRSKNCIKNRYVLRPPASPNFLTFPQIYCSRSSI